jgi:hypothetical protein
LSNPNKIKGSQFERDAAELLNKNVRKSRWQRVAGSGALGTIMHEPTLSSDVKGRVESIPQEFKVECKVGYNNSKAEGVKQFTLKKEWLDKVQQEANQSYAIPMFMGKFLGAREGVKVFVVLDVEVFAKLLNRITELDEENGKQIGRDLDSGKAVLS